MINMSRVKNFLTVVDRKGHTAEETANLMSAAERQAAASEQLINQLREIIVAPTAKMTEMRFIDMLNVIEEHSKTAERRLDKVDRHLVESADKATVMMLNIESHDEEIKSLRQQVGEELQAIHTQQKNFMDEMRHALSQSSRHLFDELTKRAGEFEAAIHNEVHTVSSSLADHIAREDKRFEEERQISTEMIDQVLLQWRTERESARREDMENLAGSMMDIGRRLMTPQPSA